jgi:peptidoglycan hydrolase CwlO-like protein
LSDIGLKKWWSVFLAVILGAGFAVSAFIKAYIYLNSLISPPPPSPSAQIGQFESDIQHGQQILDILDKGVADASARLEKMQADINDPNTESKPTEKDVADAKQDLEQKAEAKASAQRAIDEKKAKLNALEHLLGVGTTFPN